MGDFYKISSILNEKNPISTNVPDKIESINEKWDDSFVCYEAKDSALRKAPGSFQKTAAHLAQIAGIESPQVYIAPESDIFASGRVGVRPGDKGRPFAPLSDSGYSIVFGPQYRLADGREITAEELPPFVVTGFIAHEIGHILLGHLKRGETVLLTPEDSRNREYEADLHGARILCGAGEDVQGLIYGLTLTASDDQTTLPNDRHPDTPSRIERLERMTQCQNKE